MERQDLPDIEYLTELLELLQRTNVSRFSYGGLSLEIEPRQDDALYWSAGRRGELRDDAI